MPDVPVTATPESVPRSVFIVTPPPEIEPVTETEIEAVSPSEIETVAETVAEPEPETDTAPPPSAGERAETPLPEPKAGEASGEAQTVPDDAVMMLGGEPHAAPLLQSATGFVDRDRIISRTLAEIYASQGATREAVETYRLLLERIPEKRDEFAPRLKELEERLRLQPEGQKQPRE